MNLPRQVLVKCPYCGYENAIFPDDRIGPRVVLCGIDDGSGCDRYFAMEVKFKPLVIVYRMVEEAK